MKKSVVITVVLLFTFSFAFWAFGGTIVGSKHDFTGGSGTFLYNTQMLCVFCHTPHNSNANVPVLWNRSLPAAGAFTLYNSSTLDASQDISVTRFSLLCLSCHDGVTAINAVLNNPPDDDLINDTNVFDPGSDTIGAYGNNNPVNIGNSTGNLANDHPIGFVYDNALVDADRISGGFSTDQFVRPGQTQPGYVGNPADNIRLFGDGRVECTTCHDPHNPDNGRFLVKSNTGSGLCLSCHIK